MNEQQLPVRQPADLPLPAIPLRTILVATDFSEHASAVEALAAGLAKQSMARLIVAHVVGDSEFSRQLGADGALVDRLQSEVRTRVEERLRVRQEVLRQTGAEVETVLLGEGRPGERLSAEAKARGADLIVVGTHGRTGWRRLLLGSVAEEVVRTAPCPVLTIHAPSGIHFAGPIVVPTDFSPNAAVALRYAEHFAWLKRLPMTLVHAFPSAATDHGTTLLWGSDPAIEKWTEEARREVGGRLEELTAGVRSRGFEANAQLLRGSPAEAIAETAAQLQASLIVISSHGWNDWRKILLGSTAEGVVRRATCPVLVVRRGERDFIGEAESAVA